MTWTPSERTANLNVITFEITSYHNRWNVYFPMLIRPVFLLQAYFHPDVKIGSTNSYRKRSNLCFRGTICFGERVFSSTATSVRDRRMSETCSKKTTVVFVLKISILKISVSRFRTNVKIVLKTSGDHLPT